MTEANRSKHFVFLPSSAAPPFAPTFLVMMLSHLRPMRQLHVIYASIHTDTYKHKSLISCYKGMLEHRQLSQGGLLITIPSLAFTLQVTHRSHIPRPDETSPQAITEPSSLKAAKALSWARAAQKGKPENPVKLEA